MLNLLFGGPGSGKTRTVIERIRADLSSGEGQVYLLVPEQMLYSAESGILPGLPPEAGKRLSVLSFTRLCDTVADRFGGRAFGTLTRASRALLMWRTLRELHGLLETGTNPAPDGDPALCRLMLDATDELSRAAVSLAALERAARLLPSDAPLAHKLRDLSLVSAAYGGLLRELCGNDPADRLLRTAGVLEREDFFRGTTVYLDSFTSFTAPEYAALRVMLAQASAVTLTLCMKGRAGAGAQFDSMRDTVRRLERLCADVGTDSCDSVLPDDGCTAASELRILGDGLWRFGIQPEARLIPDEDRRGAVRLITARTVYGEARAAALHIGELRNAGIPYGQIAVVVRDTTAWRGVLDAALEAAHIPFFLSERTGLADRPAARLLLLALRCIRRGYQTADVVSLCKTGLCGISLTDLDAFAEYTDTWRIRGKKMSDLSAGDWSMNPDGYTTEMTARGREILAAANRVRQTVLPPLCALEAHLAVADTPAEQSRALFGYLSGLGVKDSLAASAETLLLLGKTREAGETVRLWNLLTGALADISTLLPGEEGPLSADELSAALELYFEETDMGAVPARHDCVTVGSAATLRLENMAAVLVLGLCEGEFPQPVTDTGLLTEQDKQTLENFGIEFDSRAPRLTAEELLYIWRAVTKPKQYLLLFTHTATADGSVKAPSIAFSRVRYLLPYLEPIAFPETLPEDGALVYRPPLGDTLPRPAVRRALGDQLWLSHTALQSYARCPYSFFGSRVLRLRAPIEARMDAVNAGVFLHRVLEVFLRTSLDQDRRIRHLTEEETVAAADRIMQEYMTELCGDIAGDGRLLHLFARLRAVALMLVRTVQAELEQGAFTVAGLEWDTRGRRAGDPSPLEIPLDPLPGQLPGEYDSPLPAAGGAHPDTDPDPDSPLPSASPCILMGGKIDRVDVFRDGGTVYVRVMDYKSSRHVFSEKRAWQDMNIQLLLYLFTLCAPRNRHLFADADGRLPDAVLPAEVLYLSPVEGDDGSFSPCRSGLILNNDEVLHAASADLSPDYLPGLKVGKDGTLTGAALCTAAHLEELDDTVRSLIRQVGEALYSGRAARTPGEDACRFCTMRSGCPVAERIRKL